MCVLQCYVIVFTKKRCCFSCGGRTLAPSHRPGVFLSTSKKEKNKQKNPSIDIFSAPSARQCVFVCLLSGHPSWVFLLQCFFQLANSRFPSMGLMDWHIQGPRPPLTRSPTHVNTERNNSLHSNFVALDGQQTAHFPDGALPYTEITFQSGPRLCFGDHIITLLLLLLWRG